MLLNPPDLQAMQSHRNRDTQFRIAGSEGRQVGQLLAFQRVSCRLLPNEIRELG